MQIIKINHISDFDNFVFSNSESKGSCVTVLGFFDGVHLAHRKLISEAKSIADRKNLPLLVFTFCGGDGFKADAKRLYTDEEKLKLFEELGADFAALADFSSVSDLSGENFVQKILIGKLNTDTAVCGYNFRFGKGRDSGAEELKSLMEKRERSAFVLPEYTHNNAPVSSTLIRKLLSEKKLYEAAELLGAPYFITGSVSHGLGVGKKLGIPTVNLPLDKHRFPLPVGVYVSLLKTESKTYPALTNIGNCPTVLERETHAESFILGFDGNLYGKEVKIYFIDYLREEKKFDSAKDLILQINVDKKQALERLEEKKWQEIGLNLQ